MVKNSPNSWRMGQALGDIKRAYWNISKVAEICTDFCRFVYGDDHEKIQTSKLRFWEIYFPELAPKRRDSKGYRLYNQNELYNVLRFTRYAESGDLTLQGSIKEFKQYKPLTMVLRMQRLNDEVQLPTYGSEDAACFDLRANEDVSIEPGDTVIVKTGLIFEVPVGHEAVIRPRSGISFKTNLRVANSPGTIDSDYRGEIGILLDNIGQETLMVAKGDRIAQCKLQKAEQCHLLFVENLTSTKRGELGFGSTGHS
jgi:dUTP pyrophosphatase